jgi:ADP-dependent NAD(P)H-hydrate dehydratase / NAD(P)H-hydrate epimerase
MRPVLTPEEAAALDALAEVDVGTLMERAGLALAISCSRRGVGYGDRVTVLCGPGNNGGDGYVLAKLLQERGASPLVLALAEPRSRVAIEAAGAAAASGVRIGRWRAPGPLDEVVVDAIFGAGFRGPLPDDAVPWRGVGDLRLAVDLPSGLSGHTGQPMPVCLEADWTVTFHAPKRGHLLGIGPDAVGDLEVADIGLPDVEVGWGEAEDVDAEPAPRARRAHKWSVGGVVVLGGSPGMEGAPVLAARSAIAAGAGGALVARPGGLRAATPDGLLGASIGEATRLDASVVGEVLALAGRWEVLVVGPGMGPQGAGLVRHLVERWPGPLVLDADALVADVVDDLRRRQAPAVLTPHAGEFTRLTGRAPDPVVAVDLAAALDVVVLLKGNPTVVSDGATTRLVTSGGPELATIGTGDVLAGMVGAGLLGGAEPLPAVTAAAHRHGRAGARLATTGTVTAEALVDEVGRRWSGASSRPVPS